MDVKNVGKGKAAKASAAKNPKPVQPQPDWECVGNGTEILIDTATLQSTWPLGRTVENTNAATAYNVVAKVTPLADGDSVVTTASVVSLANIWEKTNYRQNAKGEWEAKGTLCRVGDSHGGAVIAHLDDKGNVVPTLATIRYTNADGVLVDQDVTLKLQYLLDVEAWGEARPVKKATGKPKVADATTGKPKAKATA